MLYETPRQTHHQPATGEGAIPPARMVPPSPLLRFRAHALAAGFADDAGRPVIVTIAGHFDSIVHPLIPKPTKPTHGTNP